MRTLGVSNMNDSSIVNHNIFDVWNSLQFIHSQLCSRLINSFIISFDRRQNSYGLQVTVEHPLTQFIHDMMMNMEHQ